MKIAITGSTGFVGTAVHKWLKEQGYLVYSLVRTQPKEEMQIYWNPANRKIDPSQLEGMDVVIHLAGENISTRWSKKQMEKIRSSRIDGTNFLSETLSQLQSPPRLLLSASAIGYYGKNSTKERLIETSNFGNDELAEVVKEWEDSTLPAEKAGIRVVHMRFGVILHPSGGALKKMLPPFRLGLGGKLGNGQQMMSWISLKEIPRIIHFIIHHQHLTGPVNFVSPYPITNETFTKELGKSLKKPTLFTVPAPVIRILFGRMANYLLLSGNPIYPEKLLQSGYEFQEPYLEKALLCLSGGT